MTQSPIPSNPKPDIRQAAAHHQRGQLVEAEAIYKEILKSDPKNFDATHMLGVICVQRGEPELAAKQISAAVAINPAKAAAHSNLGNALRDLKRPEEALASYDRALTLQPDFADALLNRGNVLRDLKRLDDAILSYSRCIALNPANARALHSRARSFAETGRFEEALDDFNKVISLLPEDTGALALRGKVLANLKRFEEAAADFDKAVTLRPSFAEAFLNRGLVFLELGRHDAALESLKQSVALNPSQPAALHTIGNIYHVKKQPEAAIPFFERALKLDINAHATRFMLADSHFSRGRLHQAIEYAMQAIAGEPQNIRYKENFVLYSQDAAISDHHKGLENTLLECLKTPALDCTRLQGLWLHLFRLNPATKGIYSDARDFSDVTPLLSPYFLLGLEKLCVCDLTFENFLVRLRKRLLLQREKFKKENLVTLAAAMSHYCLNNEYIFDVTPEEQEAVITLGEDGADLALRACYEPLYKMKNAAEIAKRFENSAPLAAVMQAQIREPFALLEERKSIPAITPISKGVSAGVREQYEESPYPSWKSVPRFLMVDPVAHVLNKKGTQILVAGCGTGQEAAELATALPDAEILAVDLSLSSLSYASRKARELGIHNITFRQADILQLSSLDRKFDAICSGGVLHHLQDPIKGWKVLTGLLKNGGLMRIALYSKIARRHIARAQDEIKKGGWTPTAESMRDFRRRSKELLPKETLASLAHAKDYYYFFMYRDLLFHVQEHCFDIPGLAAAFKDTGVEFLKFVPPDGVLAKYLVSFPADISASSLENWAWFEKDNPDTFIAMYQFWCKKPE